jgi:E3 ubiquitin-protein ligase RNF14
MWEENKGCVVLFMWNTFLQDELFDYLDLSSPLELAHVNNPRKDSDLDNRAIQEISSQSELIPVILEFNKQEKYRQFEKTSFTCKVCFSEKAGVNCTIFSDCDHVYCNECMREYFSVQIRDGNVKGLECPEDKCESQAHPAQVSIL